MSIDDTDRLVSGKDSDSLTLGNASAHEILAALLATLREHPERADLWRMRFEMLRNIGLETEFAIALKQAYTNRTLRPELDWVALRVMWDELSSGKSPPEGVILPAAPAKKAEAKRRFSDTALQLAGPQLEQLTKEYQALRAKPGFFADYARSTREILGRPTRLYHAEKLGKTLGISSRIFLKREDQRETNPEHEMAVAHAYIAGLLARKFLITGNDVDEYSLALARVAPKFRLKLTVYMGLLDMDTKTELVEQLRELGATVDARREGEVKTGDPREAALRAWMPIARTCHLALSFGSGTGPSPYPQIVSDFQALLGYECEMQMRVLGGERPRVLVAAMHSQADSIGFMLPWLKGDTPLFYAEPMAAYGGEVWTPSARLRVYGGAKREHDWLRATGRITHRPISDTETHEVQEQLRHAENISISTDDARALALTAVLAEEQGGERDFVVLVG